jgi:hypothetical protein
VDFDPYLWHDNSVHGMRFETGEWYSRLILDIDHIVEWVEESEEGHHFRVAPADLIFDNAEDLAIDVDWSRDLVSANVQPASIDRIERIPAEAKLGRQKTFYRWTIVFNWPKDGWIALGASSLRVELRGEPLLLEEQQIPAELRKR